MNGESKPSRTAVLCQDVVSEAPERFFIAEIVREQVFLLYQQEIPYSSTVSLHQCRQDFKGSEGADFWEFGKARIDILVFTSQLKSLSI